MQGCKMLNAKYTGPYEILCHISEVTYKLDLPCHCHIMPSFHVSCLKPVTPGLLTIKVHPTTPPTPLDTEGHPVYLIKAILNLQCRNGMLEYLIECEGYGPEE